MSLNFFYPVTYLAKDSQVKAAQGRFLLVAGFLMSLWLSLIVFGATDQVYFPHDYKYGNCHQVFEDYYNFQYGDPPVPDASCPMYNGGPGNYFDCGEQGAVGPGCMSSEGTQLCCAYYYECASGFYFKNKKNACVNPNCDCHGLTLKFFWVLVVACLVVPVYFCTFAVYGEATEDLQDIVGESNLAEWYSNFQRNELKFVICDHTECTKTVSTTSQVTEVTTRPGTNFRSERTFNETNTKTITIHEEESLFACKAKIQSIEFPAGLVDFSSLKEGTIVEFIDSSFEFTPQAQKLYDTQKSQFQEKHQSCGDSAAAAAVAANTATQAESTDGFLLGAWKRGWASGEANPSADGATKVTTSLTENADKPLTTLGCCFCCGQMLVYLVVAVMFVGAVLAAGSLFVGVMCMGGLIIVPFQHVKPQFQIKVKRIVEKDDDSVTSP